MWFQCSGPDRTRACARALAEVIGEEGLVVSLTGPLGVGKTVFVKGLAEGLGIDPIVVSSPSFVIVNEYTAEGRLRLAHVDLYRVKTGRELEEAGFLDLLEPGLVVAVEWGDRFPRALPLDRLDIHLLWVPREASTPTGPPPGAEGALAAGLRRIEAQAGGRQSATKLRDWRAPLVCSGFAVEG